MLRKLSCCSVWQIDGHAQWDAYTSEVAEAEKPPFEVSAPRWHDLQRLRLMLCVWELVDGA